MRVTYVDGAWVDDEQATISVRSRALNYGLGCIGGIRGYATDDGRQLSLFRLDAHLQRLEHAAKILCLSMPPLAEASRIVLELLRRNQVRQDVYVRPLLIHNSTEVGPVLDEDSTSFIMYCQPRARVTSAAIDVCVSSWRRVSENSIPTLIKPTGSYLNSALARREAQSNGYTDAILLNEAGHVGEASTAHVFIVCGGVLISPRSTEAGLDGITRRSLIALATHDLGIEVVERPIGRNELYTADEVLLCGTGAEVTPVRSVDRRVVGDGATGEITSRLKHHFDEAVRGRVENRRGWLTAVWDQP